MQVVFNKTGHVGKTWAEKAYAARGTVQVDRGQFAKSAYYLMKKAKRRKRKCCGFCPPV